MWKVVGEGGGGGGGETAGEGGQGGATAPISPRRTPVCASSVPLHDHDHAPPVDGVQRLDGSRCIQPARHTAFQSLNRGTSLIRKRHPLGPYSMHMCRALWRS